MKRKIGDKVKIRIDLVDGEDYGNVTFVSNSKTCLGAVMEIESIDREGDYRLKGSSGWWSYEMFEDIEDKPKNEKIMEKKPNIETTVKHSESKDAWNVVGTTYKSKYKIARIPYLVQKDSDIMNTKRKAEALEHALYISYCFNNPDKVN